MTRMTYDEITTSAASDEGMPAKNRILFHCFNPNGLYAELKGMHGRIAAWVDAHPERPNGVLFAHGSLNDFPRKRLFDALDAPKRRKNVTHTIDSAIWTVRDAIKRGDAFLADESQWPEPKAK